MKIDIIGPYAQIIFMRNRLVIYRDGSYLSEDGQKPNSRRHQPTKATDVKIYGSGAPILPAMFLRLKVMGVSGALF